MSMERSLLHPISLISAPCSAAPFQWLPLRSHAVDGMNRRLLLTGPVGSRIMSAAAADSAIDIEHAYNASSSNSPMAQSSA